MITEIITAEEAREKSKKATNPEKSAKVAAKVNSKAGVAEAIEKATSKGLYNIVINDYDYFPIELESEILHKGYSLSHEPSTARDYLTGTDDVCLISWELPF